MSDFQSIQTSLKKNRIKSVLTSVICTGGSGASTFISLIDVPSSYSGAGSKLVAVKSTADGLEFISAGAGTGDVVGPSGATNNDIAVFDTGTGKLIKDGGSTIAQVFAAAVAASGNVTGPGGAVADNLASYDGATGLIIKDSGVAVSSLATFFNVFVKGTTQNRRHSLSQNGTNPGTGAMTANVLRMAPLRLYQSITFDLLGFEVTTGTTGKCRIIIYADDGTGYPGVLKYESGELTVTTPAVYEGLSGGGSQTLLPGLYWIGYFTDTANTVRNIVAAAQSSSFGTPSTIAGLQGGSYTSSLTYTSGALPDPFPAGATILSTAAANTVPFCSIRII